MDPSQVIVLQFDGNQFPGQIYLVLLENCMEGDDGIYFKWYCAESPALV